ncbi:MAG: hypothetical protein A2V52_03475 [Actinobacteria bacterium RBG_19FT_COMBO_54_7]|uniref:Uncharacterized protein n=1 Tax=Candidatus Solincola sediminis TaxID=1797199 RepID=A0A1F2WQA5_9ACTN|nr:MAG: hypothetical protein A2Y75_00750 [Candidatus Solincola sediminis]OFW61443.1 MAG: hypothetical protein A2W01_09690 [Candidatus Solincola sediminis]OFW66814.1 MAG: hypothetical protein A2V52_03475 [Actinobacteria bacterium RBG_19FT_COMBO_54_7]
MKSKSLSISFFAMIAALVLALALTVYGSATNSDIIMNTGIIAWPATSALIFIWLILRISVKLTRYGRGKTG